MKSTDTIVAEIRSNTDPEWRQATLLKALRARDADCTVMREALERIATYDAPDTHALIRIAKDALKR